MGNQQSQQERILVQKLLQGFSNEELASVFLFLSLEEIATFSLICKKFRNVIERPDFWRQVLHRYFPLKEKEKQDEVLNRLLSVKYDSQQLEWKERCKQFKLTELHKRIDLNVWGEGMYFSGEDPGLVFNSVFVGITEPLAGIKALLAHYKEFSGNYDQIVSFQFLGNAYDGWDGKFQSFTRKEGSAAEHLDSLYSIKLTENFADYQKINYRNYHKYIEKVVKPFKKKAEGVFLCFDVSSGQTFTKLKDCLEHFKPTEHIFFLVGIAPENKEREVSFSKIWRYKQSHKEYNLTYFELSLKNLGDVANRGSRVLSAIEKLKREVTQIFHLKCSMTKALLRRKLEKKDKKVLKFLRKNGIKLK